MEVSLLLWVLAIVLVALGLAGLVLLAMPGVPVLFAGLVLAVLAFSMVGTFAIARFF